jgi:nucleotide-binding universal stress UspA family protein
MSDESEGARTRACRKNTVDVFWLKPLESQMSVKTILVGPLFDASIEEHRPSESLMRYAIDLALSQGAHISIAIGLAKLTAPSALLKEVRGVIAATNRERRLHVETFASDAMEKVAAAGLVGDIATFQDDFVVLLKKILAKALLADLAILEASGEILSAQQALVEEVLFHSGRPVIITPKDWSGDAAPERVIVSWDGTARAARALGDALPLLESAKKVEIVCVSGDPDGSKRFEGTDIAHNLARHCRSVTVEQLPSQGEDIAVVLGRHAKLVRANLLVMGAYGHSRLTQFLLGGVTRSMILEPPIPVFLSH